MTHALIDQDIQPTDRLLDRLADGVETTVGVEGTAASIVEALAPGDAVVVTSRLKLTREVLAEARPCLVGKLGTGIDNVDLEAAAEFGIPVTYTPGINALSVAEHALGLALAALRRTTQVEAILRSGGWRDATPIGTQLSGTTVGIVGFGNIGSRLANLLRGFDVTILAYDPYVQVEDTQITGAELTDLETLLERSDVVSINASHTEETRGMIDAAAFARMRETAVLVNTARGPIVDEAALIEAVRTGEIAGAGLDVFADEPLSPDSPLHDLPTVVTTPHVAARTAAAAEATIDQLAANVNALLAGEPVPDRYLAVAPSR